MDRCGSCGAAVTADAAWCGQCYAPARAAARSVMDPVETAADRTSAPTPTAPVAARHSRWRGGPTTFGPVGRLVMTLLMLVPLWFFWATQGFAWPGLVIWGVFVLPWGLRDIWRRTRVRAG